MSIGIVLSTALAILLAQAIDHNNQNMSCSKEKEIEFN